MEYSEAEVIARVGDRVITKSDFIMRAEYTPRPIYCRSDNKIHKKIVLNSLIAEKLLALDLEARPEYSAPPGFNEYLTGRKEQAMRQLHRYEHGIKKASPSMEMLNRGLRNARREYHVAFFTLPNSSQLDPIQTYIEQDSSLESIARKFKRSPVLNERKVSWFDDDEQAILEALYTRPLARDSILTPIILRDGSIMLVKVLGWEDKYSLSESANQTLWEDVVSKVELRMGNELYRGYLTRLMRGKSFQLEKETFQRLVEDIANTYMLKDAQKETILSQVIWDIEKTHLSYGEIEQDVEYLDQVLFTYDGESWTVQDLFKMIAKHPLVFRDVRFPKSDFANQLRMAVADLLRDNSITEDAYKQGFADRVEIRSHVQLWKDHYLADVYKQIILASLPADERGDFNSLAFIEEHMNPLVDRLQAEYSDQIFINFDLFDSVDLTGVDMFVTQEGVAYPIVTPSFPQIYTDHVFDYGNKIEL
ncbi:MAG: hypothetical protein K9N35_10835 [Candidatus Marinimicrobia bacterium]|nr:hypothetical protein [Candidatus Neomarinimicrobiota bacterium]